MTWDMATVSEQKARKVYHCEASEWIDNSGYSERDYTPEDWLTIEKARSEDYEIRIGTNYVKTAGKWEGEFSVFRARKDLNLICHKYKFYED